MCMGTPEAPPPPPPPPAAPPVLEQDTPKLSDANEDTTGLDQRSKGFKAYKIKKNQAATTNKTMLGGMVQNKSSNK